MDDRQAELTPATEEYVDKRVNEALSAYRRQALVGFLILLVGLIAASVRTETLSDNSRQAIVDSGDVVAVSGCNRDYDTIDALRDQLEVSLDRIDQLERDGTYTHAQAKAGRESTHQFLDKYQLPDCRPVQNILTAEPGASFRIPEPRYPGDPQQQADEAREADSAGHPVNGQ